MADAYGAVVLSMSNGCKVDEEKLLKQLRDLRWSNDGNDTDWTFEDKQYFAYGYNVQYPTVRPEHRVTLHYTDADGNVLSVPWSEATEEQWEAEYDVDSEPMTLADLSKHFEDCVLSGKVTIAATSNEKCRYVDFESITIDSDSCITYVSQHVSTSNGSQGQFEEYNPKE